MAKAKKASRAPAGFKEIGGMAASWMPKKAGDSIMGKMLGVEVVKVKQKEGKKTVIVPKNVYKIADANGEIHKVWQSAGLKALELVKKGAQVFVEFTGMGKAKPGQSAPRLYRVMTK